jgi:hypothetical protein
MTEARALRDQLNTQYPPELDPPEVGEWRAYMSPLGFWRVDRETSEGLARADHGAERLRGQLFSLPSVQDCYHCANRCLDMWNDSVDHAARSRLLRMADAWLQSASESDKRRL